MKPKPPLEKVEQQHIVQLVRSLGGAVYILGTKRRKGDYQGTNQTPGVPDLLAFVPVRGSGVVLHCYIEVKRKGGVMSEAQEGFQAACMRSGVRHVVGTYDDVLAMFIDWGVLDAVNVPAEWLGKTRRRVY